MPGTETLNSAGVPWYACPCTGFSTYRFWVFAMRAGAPVLAPPTDYFANSTSMPRSSLVVLAEVAASALACTMITAKYDKPTGGAACVDPATRSCTPSALTSTACDAPWGQPSVFALPVYFYTMRVNVAFSNVAVFKGIFAADAHRQLNVSADRLVFFGADTFDASRTVVTIGVIERAAGSDEPDAATAAALFLTLSAASAAPDVLSILSPGAAALRDTSFAVSVNARSACVHQVPVPFVDDPALCSAPSYVAPVIPAPAIAARGTAVGRTVMFKLNNVTASSLSHAKFNAAVVRTLGLIDASMFELDVGADAGVVSVLFRYAIFGSEKAAQDAAALFLSQAILPHSLLASRLFASGMPIDANTPVVAAIAFSCGDGTTSSSPTCAHAPAAPAAPSSAGLSTGHVVGLIIAGCVFGAFLAGFGVFMYHRKQAVAGRAKAADLPYHELSMVANDAAVVSPKRSDGHGRSDHRRPDSP